MKCPNCNVDLVMSERSGVEIDYCPTCRGVWLDRGELDKIIERSSDTGHYQPTPRDTQPNHSYSGEQRYDPKRKKKESFLGDLFDF